MDLNQDVWDGLRETGHTIGTPYVQDGVGLRVVVDGVAMSVADARAVNEGCVTVAQVAVARKRTALSQR